MQSYGSSSRSRPPSCCRFPSLFFFSVLSIGVLVLVVEYRCRPISSLRAYLFREPSCALKKFATVSFAKSLITNLHLPFQLGCVT